ncbi:MAG: nuclear transport factor 2 family protein, partial [Gammaproteobacteria bacterium]
MNIETKVIRGKWSAREESVSQWFAPRARMKSDPVRGSAPATRARRRENAAERVFSALALSVVLALGLTGAAHAQTPASSSAPAPDLQPKLTSAYAKVELIAAKAARVRDIDELRNLQAAYGYYVDKALWDDVADLFTENGTMELGLNGVYAGKNSIRKYLYSLTGGKPGLRAGELNNHFQLSPVITLAPDGQSAKARWRGLIQ